jgi:hypothetical protein
MEASAAPLRSGLVLVFALAAAGAVLGVNVTPSLSGRGKLFFPESKPSAYLEAIAGALTIAAGGTNKGISLTPSGTGTLGATSASAAPASGGDNGVLAILTPGNPYGLRMGVLDSTYTWIQSYASLPLRINPRGNDVLVGANLRVGGTTPATYALDATGDVNASGVFRVEGAQVVGPRGAAVAAPTGGGGSSTNAIDLASRAAINDLISRLQAHGLIA